MEAPQETTVRLKLLIQADIDAIHAYQQAIEAIGESELRTQMSCFRDEHNRHAAELSTLVRRYGGEPPVYSPANKNFVLPHFAPVSRLGGTENALAVMRHNAEYAARLYDEARGWELPEAADAMVERNSRDEKRHLGFFNHALETRLWENYPRFQTRAETDAEQLRGRMGPTAS